MSDHADIVKRALSWCEEGEMGNRHREAGLAALDALVAERKWAVDYAQKAVDRAEAAEAENARLRREIHDTATWLSLWTEQGEDHPRAVSLRAALGEEA